MHTLEIPRGGDSREPSKIVIGAGAASQMTGLLSGRPAVAVMDSRVYGIYGPELAGGIPVLPFDTSHGEQGKTLEAVDYICRSFLEMGVDRSWAVAGIGGGITTDIVGFAASVYMRGVASLGFVSTTLLAQVDASVGGKNGVNLGGYKNIIGVFNQPDWVLCDTSLLDSLPEREMRSGMAEVVKCGLIGDRALFERIEKAALSRGALSPGELLEAIRASVALKARIVSEDERELGARKLLNLGHTFGHAIEKCSSRFSHGEAVAIGLHIASKVSVALGLLPPGDAARVGLTLEMLGLPTECGIPDEQLLAAVSSDKKKHGATIDFVVMTAPGHADIRPLTLDELRRLLG